jgi:hypothetical protein
MPVLLVAAAAFAQPHVASAQATTSFPKLGGYLIGSPQNYDNAQYAAQIAKLDIAILSVWPGWAGSTGGNMQQAVSAIKAINPKEIILLYNDINELQNPASSPFASVGAQLNNNGWWLYSAGSGGSVVASSWGNGFYETNTTLYSSTNASGQHYVDWRAAWEVQNFATPNPAIDGFFTDNVFWAPRVNGDWNRDGVSDSSGNATVQSWYRQGYAAYFKDLKAGMPGKYQTGNIADWGQSNAVYPEYQGVLQGGLMEGMIGQSWSYESMGWQQLMAAYRKMMAAIAAPQLVIFQQDGSATDYQGMRYGLASCLMGDAYYYYDIGGSHAITWFDEFNAALGPATSSAFPASAWQNGVYRRDFQNGIALVNPKGNGPRTVTLETSYKHLSGSQAPSVNNGQTVTTVTLNDRDGVILLRQSAQAVPDAPTLTVQ